MAQNILIWGEFPPATSTGVSISNKTVRDYLIEWNQPVAIIEEISWNKGALRKFLHYLKLYVKLAREIRRNRPRLFYFSFPLSVFGELKFLPPLMIIKILSRNTKILAHLHRGDFNAYITQNWANRVLTGCLINQTHEIIVLAERFRKELKNFKPGKTINVLPNTSAFQNEPDKRKGTYGKRFICISNYIRTKGVEDLYECFSTDELKEFRLSIYGGANDASLYNKLKSSAPSNIKILGKLSRDEVSHVLCEHDCLIMPSWNEGQPIVILEAISLGLPVIATRVGDVQDMLGEEYPFLANPKDISSLKDAIVAFDRYDMKNQLSKELLGRYHSRYSNIRFEETLKSILSSDK